MACIYSMPLTAALTSPRRCHNEAAAGGYHNILSAATRYTVAMARAAHALHARSDLRARVSSESASRSRPRVAHSCVHCDLLLLSCATAV